MSTATINTLPDCRWCEKPRNYWTCTVFSTQKLTRKSDLFPTVPYIEIDGVQIGGFIELSVALRKM